MILRPLSQFEPAKDPMWQAVHTRMHALTVSDHGMVLCYYGGEEAGIDSRHGCSHLSAGFSQHWCVCFVSYLYAHVRTFPESVLLVQITLAAVPKVPWS
jgi:hypothetical protein